MLIRIFTYTQAWLNGGYSDDLTLAAQCGSQGLAVAAPSFAIFPQRYVYV